MSYEINVSLRGKHFFATHPRSLTSKTELLQVYKELEKKFPASEGYSLGASYQPEISYGVLVDTTNDVVANSYYESIKIMFCNLNLFEYL